MDYKLLPGPLTILREQDLGFEDDFSQAQTELYWRLRTARLVERMQPLHRKVEKLLRYEIWPQFCKSSYYRGITLRAKKGQLATVLAFNAYDFVDNSGCCGNSDCYTASQQLERRQETGVGEPRFEPQQSIERASSEPLG